jgi:NADH:ubiquinone oxidoreductase subunit 5 (subunit L)/multisubunit Na+/H+ antiporter MnhA subunit
LVKLTTWFKIGFLNVEWSFYFDKLSTVLLVLIIFISLLVHLFALDYLNEDPHLSRFLMLLSLFTIFMEILVTSGNLIQFFLGWEAVGLLSYLLINFWFTRYAASNSGLMAIIYNRVGDSGLLLGISLICFILETTDFLCLFLMIKFLCQIQIQIFSSYFYVLDLLTILLFLGVIGKSAQIFLES